MPSQVTSTSTDPEARRSGWSWLLPAGTFLAGCALGAVVTGVGDVRGGDEPSPSASSAAAGDASDTADEGTADGEGGGSGEDSDVTVRVPEACLQTADDATALVDSVDRVVAAVADLDPRRLRQTVDDVQQVRDEVQDEAEQCRKAAAERLEESSGAEAEGDALETPSS